MLPRKIHRAVFGIHLFAMHTLSILELRIRGVPSRDIQMRSKNRLSYGEGYLDRRMNLFRILTMFSIRVYFPLNTVS